MFPMVLAVLLDRVENRCLSTFYRIVLLIPSMIPAPLIFVLWVWLYNNYIGPINYFLVDVLRSVRHPYPAAMARQPKARASSRSRLWNGGGASGTTPMFFLAGLASIPKDLFDAAGSMAPANGACSGGSPFFACSR